MPRGQDGFLILDPAGVVVLRPRGGLVAPEDLREFTERFLAGRITYPTAGPSPENLVGNKFPDLRVRDLWDSKVSNLSSVSPPGREYVVYAGGCPVCVLQAAFRKIGKGGEAGRTAIFSSRFPLTLLRSMARDAKVRVGLYQAVGGSPA